MSYLDSRHHFASTHFYRYRAEEPEVLTGILYIHPDDDCRAGRTSLQTIRTLVGLLGEPYLERMTILIQSRTGASSIAVDQSVIDDFTANPESPLYPFYVVKNEYRPTTLRYTLNPGLVETILYRFAQKHSEPFLAQQKLINGSWKCATLHSNMRDFLSDRVGYLAVPDRPISSLLQRKNEEIDNLHGVIQDVAQRLRKSTQKRDIELSNTSRMLQARSRELEALRKSLAIQEQKYKELEKSYRLVQGEVEKLSEMVREKDKEVWRLRGLALEEDQDFQIIRKAIKVKAKELEALCESMPERRSDLEYNGLRAEFESSMQEKDREIRKLRDELEEKDEEIRKLKSNNEFNNSKPPDRGEIRDLNINANLRKATEDTEEYVSRAHAQNQPEERIEQTQIMQGLKDVNRLIEDLGQSMAIYLVDHFPSHTTSIEAAFRSRELLNILGYSKRNPPSLKVLRSARLDIEDFLFNVVRMVLCYQLYTQLFEPFHPGIANSKPQTDLVNGIYAQMKLRGLSNYVLCLYALSEGRVEPQFVTGRWRRDSFNSISASTGQSYDTMIYPAVLGSLHVLLRSFFDSSLNVKLSEEHETTLRRLVDMAERWNRLMKGSVTLLGEFQPVAYPCGSPFKAKFMTMPETEEAKTNKSDYPGSILGTVELGLIKHIALGNNQQPEETILSKAAVVDINGKYFG